MAESAKNNTSERKTRIVRIICSDPYATESSSDEHDQTRSKKRIVHEIILDPIVSFPSNEPVVVNNISFSKRVLARRVIKRRYRHVRRRKWTSEESRVCLSRKREIEAKREERLKMKVEPKTKPVVSDDLQDMTVEAMDLSGKDGGGADLGSMIVDANGFLLGEFSRLDVEMQICESQDPYEY